MNTLEAWHHLVFFFFFFMISECYIRLVLGVQAVYIKARNWAKISCITHLWAWAVISADILEVNALPSRLWVRDRKNSGVEVSRLVCVTFRQVPHPSSQKSSRTSLGLSKESHWKRQHSLIILLQELIDTFFCFVFFFARYLHWWPHARQQRSYSFFY